MKAKKRHAVQFCPAEPVQLPCSIYKKFCEVAGDVAVKSFSIFLILG